MSTKRRVWGHAALLVVATVWALQSWRAEGNFAERPDVIVWQRDSMDVTEIVYRSPEKTLTISRMDETDGEGSYLWAVEARDSAKPAFVGQLPMPDTLRYPVGASGSTLVQRWATLGAIRELGSIPESRREALGLDRDDEIVQVSFRGGERRQIVVGDSIFGGPDRYALDPASGAAYVISRNVVNPLAMGEGAIRERWIHEFMLGDARQVRATGSAGQERRMTRTSDGGWVEEGEETSDQAFANFIQRVDELAIAGFWSKPSQETSERLLLLEFLDDQDEVMGFLELLQDTGRERDQFYIRSERTRVFAEAVTVLAERVSEALPDAF